MISLFLTGAGLALAGGLLWTMATSMVPTKEDLRLLAGQTPEPPRLTRLFSPIMPAYARTELLQENDPGLVSVVVENFDDIPLGGFPAAWKAWRGDDDLARNLYSIQEEDGNPRVLAERGLPLAGQAGVFGELFEDDQSRGRVLAFHGPREGRLHVPAQVAVGPHAHLLDGFGDERGFDLSHG